MTPKVGETRPVIIQNAQNGDPQAQAQLLQENRPLIYKILSGWGILPSSIGKDAYHDFIGEIELHILQQTLPGYKEEGAAKWSTWLYNSVNNFITDIVYKGGRRNPMREELTPNVSLNEPTYDNGEESQELQEKIPDVSSLGMNPQVELLLESAKQQLSPVDQMILEYRVMGYSAGDIAAYFQQNNVNTPRGGTYDTHMISWRWSKVIKPLLEQYFPEYMRSPYNFQKGQYETAPPPPYEKPFPAYRVNPETGERTQLPQETANNLSLRKTATLDVLDYIRIGLLYG